MNNLEKAMEKAAVTTSVSGELSKTDNRPSNIGVTPAIALAAALLDVPPSRLRDALREHGDE